MKTVALLTSGGDSPGMNAALGLAAVLLLALVGTEQKGATG